MMVKTAPKLKTEPGWSPVDPFPKFGGAGSFIPRDRSDGRLRISYFFRKKDGALKASAWFGPGSEGPPGRAHGGSVAAVLDEALGAAVWIAGWPVLTARFSVTYRKGMPIGTEAEVQPKIIRKRGRKVYVRGTLSAPRIGRIAEAEGLYLVMPDAVLPESLARTMLRRRGTHRD